MCVCMAKVTENCKYKRKFTFESEKIAKTGSELRLIESRNRNVLKNKTLSRNERFACELLCEFFPNPPTFFLILFFTLLYSVLKTTEMLSRSWKCYMKKSITINMLFTTLFGLNWIYTLTLLYLIYDKGVWIFFFRPQTKLYIGNGDRY